MKLSCIELVIVCNKFIKCLQRQSDKNPSECVYILTTSINQYNTQVECKYSYTVYSLPKAVKI